MQLKQQPNSAPANERLTAHARHILSKIFESHFSIDPIIYYLVFLIFARIKLPKAYTHITI